MNEAVHQYTKADLRDIVPPMPDLYCRQADGVYVLQPLTGRGRSFLEGYDELFQADEIRVSSTIAFPMFDAIFDGGLTVV